MDTLYQNYAGIERTLSLKKDIELLLADGILAEDILILTLTKNEFIRTSDIKSVPLERIITQIIENSKVDFQKKVVPDFLAKNIIFEICKKTFDKSSPLYNYNKSNAFSSELYKLFGRLKNDRIKIINIPESLSDADKKRLDLINTVYQSYNKFLEENLLLDYRDSSSAAIDLLTNEFKKYKYILVSNSQDITNAQKELINLIGENVKYYTTELGNSGILERAIFLSEKYAGVSNTKTFSKSQHIGYLQFEDIKTELEFIGNEILNKKDELNLKFSDFCILTVDTEIHNKITDILKLKNIPLNKEMFNEQFNNYKVKLIRYLSICNILSKFGLDEFNKKAFEKISISRAEKEILFSELNLYFENILNELFESNYLKDRLMSIFEEFEKPSLLHVIYENVSTMDDNDREIVLSELGFIAKIYLMYKDSARLTDIALLTYQKEKNNIDTTRTAKLFKLLLGQLKDFESLYFEKLNSRPSLENIVNVISQDFEENTGSDDFVNVLPLSRVKGKKHKYVFIPCMVENSIPKNLQAAPTFIFDRKMQDILFPSNRQNELKMFYFAMTSASEKLYLSTHIYEDKKPVLSSEFFNILEKADKQNFEKHEAVNIFAENEVMTGNQYKTQESVVIKTDDVLKLNASSISYFQACPRKYYFSNLLNLKEKRTYAATYGTVVHTIMQLFGEKYLSDFNKYTLIQLTEMLFGNKKDLALNAGFNENEIDFLYTASELERAQMRDDFLSAIDELDENGFFDKVPDKIITEKSFKFSIPELPNIIFDGRIDAIFQYGNEYVLVDYKTGSENEYELSYYISEYGINFLKPSGKPPSNMEKTQNAYKYQIPLYYLACLYSEDLKEFKDKIAGLGLKYIRPSHLSGGCFDDFVEASLIDLYKDKIIENLKSTVIDKIKDVKFFVPVVNYYCEDCPYNFICDREDKNE